MTGYTKIEKEGDQDEDYYYYRNSLGTQLYSGYTNPSMSYPVKVEGGFHNFNENAQFYPLNDHITLVIEQDERIGYVNKEDPRSFVRIRRSAGTLNIPNDQTYRVFFYSDSRFTIS